jgi:hypothetical protein
MFENGNFYTNIQKMFPKFYTDNGKRINLLFTQVLDEIFKRDDSDDIEDE